ncbi:MAG TPA: response regulator transcription factor [Candidatus Blautia excrementipullorum]|nr:response regulator transcription factor [Candidatus Blautia excrementipullorum]
METKSPAKILLLEDDPDLIDGLGYALNKNGFQTDVAQSVSEAFQYLHTSDYQLLILDITLPDGTGYDVCEKVRKAGSHVPILFLTALDEEVNIIRGLDGGGDDYMIKPFRLGELCSRIRALLRRSGTYTENNAVLRSGPISVDLSSGNAWLNGHVLELTLAEYRLLCLFLRHPNQLLTRAAILDALWDGSGNYVDDNTLSVYIRRLREKIEPFPSSPQYLLTVRGFGYRWKEESK